MMLFAALREDSQQGWIWLQNSGFPARSIIKITNPLNKKAVYCEALQIEENFLSLYNSQSHRKTITNPQSSIVINGWYRAKLGDLSTQTEVALKIQPCNSWWRRWWGCFRACTDHPQVVVRVAAWLGCISVGLGLFGIKDIIISIVSFFKTLLL